MANFYTDNSDLPLLFKRLDLQHVVAILEDNFTPDPDDPLRPESYQEAMAVYEAALTLCGDISANYIAPRSEAIDRDGASLVDGSVEYSRATREAQQCLADAGFMGVIIPRRFGGMNFPATIYIMMIEMVSQADASMMTMFGYQDVGEAIAKLADDSVAQALLPEYCQGGRVGAMVLTEPGGGSDLQAVRVAASQDENGQWYLNGTKHFISHGNGEVLLVLARSETDTPGMFGLSLFAVHGGKKSSVRVAKVEEKMGLHGSPTCELVFENARADLVGRQKFGLFHVVEILNHARFSVAAQAIGIAQAAYITAAQYAQERRAFGKLIGDMPPIDDMLAEMRTTLSACRSMVYAGAQWLDKRNKLEEHLQHLKARGEKPSVEDRIALREAQKMLDLLSPLVKYTVTEHANRICYAAQQVHGGIGYMRGMVVERCIRDVRITTIYEGTTQVQVGLASKHVLADTLANYFDTIEQLSLTEEGTELQRLFSSLRAIFSEIKATLDGGDEYLKQAGARDLTDTYAGLYGSALLIDESASNPNRSKIAHRFLVQSIAAASAGHAKVVNGYYRKTDIGLSDYQ